MIVCVCICIYWEGHFYTKTLEYFLGQNGPKSGYLARQNAGTSSGTDLVQGPKGRTSTGTESTSRPDSRDN